jgi:hypothetical protein
MNWFIKLRQFFWSLLRSCIVQLLAFISSILTEVVFHLSMRRFSVYAVAVSDDVLVAAAYYTGTEKEYNGARPFAMLAYITTACMISSEFFAKSKERQRQISPATTNTPSIHVCKTLVISNFIPFTTLNLIFALSNVICAIIKVIQPTQIGVPNLSIQMVVMQICLLFSNSDAKKYFKRRYAAFREVDQIQTIKQHEGDAETGL